MITAHIKYVLIIWSNEYFDSDVISMFDVLIVL